MSSESRIERANRLLSGEVLDEPEEAPPEPPKRAIVRVPPRAAPKPVPRPVVKSTGKGGVSTSRGSKRPPALLESEVLKQKSSRRAADDEDEEEDDGEEGESEEDDEDDEDGEDGEDDEDEAASRGGSRLARVTPGGGGGADGDDEELEEPDGLTISTGLTLPHSVVTESIGIVAQRGAGKALALDTPIPTPVGWTTMGKLAEVGWTTMGELVEGDEIFDERGDVCRVVKATEVMRDHLCYRVVFSDGSEVVADAEHLWRTEQNGSGVGVLVTTEDIKATLRSVHGSFFNHYIRGTTPFAEKTYRAVVSVEAVPSVPVRCIAVDSPSHLYLAGRGMVPTHNTYLTTVLAEEMSLSGLPFVVLDPMGVYWGLRSSSDGATAGLPVIVLGGSHGDMPLDPAGGRAIARWVLANRVPAVLDLSDFRRADQRLFVGDFAEELFESCEDPLHVIVDEADLFIPQKPLPEDKRCLAAFEDIVRRGRSRGLGTTVVTQRPAVINKDILTQIGTLVVLRMTGPQDLDAIKDWVRSHGDLTRQRLMLASLPSLPIGTGWFWSPGWLGVLKRVQIRKKFTWDSSVTPKIGVPRPVPDVRAEVNIDVLREAVTNATEHDPNSTTSLKARIKELERALNEKEGAGSTVTKLQAQIAALEHRLMTRPPAAKPSIDSEAVVNQVNALTKVVGELVKEVRKKS